MNVLFSVLRGRPDREHARILTALWISVSLTFLAVAVIGLGVWRGYDTLQRASRDAAHFGEILREILIANDARGNLIRTAAATGNDTLLAEYEVRKRTQSRELARALTVESRLPVRPGLRRLREVHGALLVCESEALTFVAAGDRWAAIGRLMEPEYLRLERDYLEVVRGLASSMEANRTVRYRAFRRHLMVRGLLSVLFSLGFAAAWGRVLHLTGRSLERRRRMAAKLAENEAKYRTLMDTLPQAVLIAQDRRVQFGNPSAAAMFGYATPEQLVGLGVTDVFPERDREHLLAWADGIYSGQSPMMETRVVTMLRANGEEFPADVTTRVVTYNGQPALQVVMQDITERQLVDAALRESEAMWRAFLDAIPQPACLLAADRTILALNSAMAARLGRRAGDLIGQNALTRFGDQLSTVRNEDLGRVLETGKPLCFEDAADGQHWIQSFTPVRDAAGQVTRVALFSLDITERKQAEDALRESEERFRNLADSAPVLIWIAGMRRHTYYFNKMWLSFTGRRLGQEYGTGWMQWVHPEDIERYLAVYEAAFASRRPYTAEYRIKHADGRYHWVLESAVPRLSPEGQFAGFIGTCVDISDRRETEDLLREGERKFRELVALLPQPVFEADASGRITFGNRKALELYGLTQQDLDRGVTAVEMIMPEDQVRVMQGFANVLRGDLVHHKEYYARRRDGSSFPVLIDTVPVTVDGVVTGLRGVIVDMTELKRTQRALEQDVAERRRAEAALGESQRMLTTLLSNLPGMAYRCRNDAAWTMEFVSAGSLALCGYQAGELMGNRVRSYGDIIHVDDRAQVWEHVQAALAARQPFQIGYRIVTATGEVKRVIEQGRGVYDAAGELQALEGFVSTTKLCVRGADGCLSPVVSAEDVRALVDLMETTLPRLAPRGPVGLREADGMAD